MKLVSAQKMDWSNILETDLNPNAIFFEPAKKTEQKKFQHRPKQDRSATSFGWSLKCPTKLKFDWYCGAL